MRESIQKEFRVPNPENFDVRFRLRVRQGETIAIGPGKIDLLAAVQACGSISAAARSLGMSYRRAWMLLEELNASLSSPATVSEQGGVKGGGSVLTPVGEEVIRIYRAIDEQARLSCARDIERLTALLK